MGLDTSHGCWHGSYSAFMRWRRKIASLAGIPLPLMQAFYEPPDADLIERTKPRVSAFTKAEGGGVVADRNSLTAALADMAERGDAGRWERWTREFIGDLPIAWEILKPDPIHKLLYHSDCNGEILPEDCGPIADSLERLLPLLPDEEDWGHIGNWRKKTQQFIDGLRLAASLGEAVRFH
jgi:hypothetical protein